MSSADTERKGRELFDATRPFAIEVPLRSWWHVSSTLVLLILMLAIASLLPWWPARLCASALAGLLFVRAFILYHDFMHGSLLRGSWLAKAIFYPFGWIALTPPHSWKYSHNFHHAHVGKPLCAEESAALLVTSDVGSFPLMTTAMWQGASTWQRLRYRLSRHPVTLLCAYATVFLTSICLLPLLRNPRKYWDGALSLAVHAACIVGICLLWGLPVLIYSFLLPLLVATAAGAYLFYAQHNFEGMRVLGAEDWTYYRGATESSSYMRLSAILEWFTGNIGYHHVHHLNSLIPFYRLPEAMAAIPELQHPKVTSLNPRDIISCLRLNLWDPSSRRLVSYREGFQTT